MYVTVIKRVQMGRSCTFFICTYSYFPIKLSLSYCYWFLKKIFWFSFCPDTTAQCILKWNVFDGRIALQDMKKRNWLPLMASYILLHTDFLFRSNGMCRSDALHVYKRKRETSSGSFSPDCCVDFHSLLFPHGTLTSESLPRAAVGPYVHTHAHIHTKSSLNCQI